MSDGLFELPSEKSGCLLQLLLGLSKLFQLQVLRCLIV